MKRNGILVFVGIIVAFMAVGITAYFRGNLFTEHGSKINQVSISEATLDAAIERSKIYLVNACGADGKFVYRIDSETGAVLPNYNIIRHAGAVYSLGAYYDHRPEPEVLGAVSRATGFIKMNYIGPAKPDKGQDRVLAIWSKPVGSVGNPSASLGAAGLGLVALTEAERMKAGTTPTIELEGIGRFILFLQRDDGGFYAKFDGTEGPEGENESLYYPGEASLGLISLYELTHSNQWLIAAGKALSFLVKSRQGQTQVPADHWALIATSKILPYYGQSKCSVSQDELVQHAVQICRCILKEQINDPGRPELDGSFDLSGRTTPTAIRVEGLLAALDFIPEDQTELRAEIGTAARRGVQFLLRAQIESGPYSGGMPRSINLGSNNADLRMSEIRIDYVQHALCAFLHYQRLFQRPI